MFCLLKDKKTAPERGSLFIVYRGFCAACNRGGRRPSELRDYISSSADCRTRQTPVIPAQQEAPRRIGLPPFFISLTIFVFRPMAAIARMIKNLLSSFTGPNVEAETP